MLIIGEIKQLSDKFMRINSVLHYLKNINLNFIKKYYLMNTISFVCFMLIGVLGVLSTTIPRTRPIQNHPVRTYKVSLDVSPHERWKDIIHDYKDEIKAYMDYISEEVTQESYRGAEKYTTQKYFSDQNFISEVRAISDLSGYQFEKILYHNYIYQFETYKMCTGIVIRTQDNKIIHGRNFDHRPQDIVASLLLKAQFYKNNKRIYSIDLVAGTVFAITGIRFGAFAINANSRETTHYFRSLTEFVKQNKTPTVWLVRKVLEEEQKYSSALRRLKYEITAGPVYFTISGVGPNQGAIVQRDSYTISAFEQLNETNWFIVHTNYDRAEQDPLDDRRRAPVQKKLRIRGNKNINEDTLFKKYLSIWPTFDQATVMSTVMVPSTGYHSTIAWYGSNPKSPQSN